MVGVSNTTSIFFKKLTDLSFWGLNHPFSEQIEDEGLGSNTTETLLEC